MSRKEERIECMEDILQTLGIQASSEQIAQLTEDFSLHLEMEREIDSHQHVGYKEECNKCKLLEAKLKESEKLVSIYHKNVCIRRKTEDVWVEGETVMYRPN